MRLWYIFLTSAFFANVCISQETNKSAIDNGNIYLIALTQHLGYLNSVSKEPADHDLQQQIINVEAAFEIYSKLPSRVGSFKINYFNKDQIANRTRKGKSLYLSEITPIMVSDELLIIRISRFHVSSLNGKLLYGRVGGTIVKFKYNCKQNKFDVFHVDQTDQ